MTKYIHEDKDFYSLISIVSNQHKIDAALIEKDYWIMHVLYFLEKDGYEFELKGGTSLSKGFKLIERFSEDIDIHIKDRFGLNVEGNSENKKIRENRKLYYDKLAQNIKINGIVDVSRAIEFDDSEKYRSGGYPFGI